VDADRGADHSLGLPHVLLNRKRMSFADAENRFSRWVKAFHGRPSRSRNGCSQGLGSSDKAVD
jgi:hypothetical protein